ncbi:Tryptophan biosynthesis protein TrpCF [Buchnera aphidicola (Tetraneura ulmi)]|uniref:bifunctional indole-3-glycerol-phosphate synthase TrpC/phosphoribosylanthranilate isomerase TrpF n=1 Tax=Buchnera aphidicola TaxID=9 RepID=UPI00346477B6
MQETVLKKIIENKKTWIKEKKFCLPLLKIKKKIKNSNRDFYSAIKSVRPAYIFEFKKSSPSSGILNHNFNLFKISSIYKKYASAISVVTDEKFFQGSFEYIPIIKSYLHQPILCKDFFIDPYQIYLARYYGSDAILLMLSVLEDNQYLILSEIAKSMNMSVLTEIHNENELKRAIKLNASIIGINNRNLHDFSIDINITKKLSIKTPDSKVLISESGIKNYNQIRKLSKLVDGFLIGTHIMTSLKPENTIRSLIFGNNKVCGLTRSKDAKRAYQSGSIYGGLIFCENSIRKINETHAKKIILNEKKLKFIGVFCNNSIEYVSKITNNLSLFGIQLHGNENQEYIKILLTKISKNTKIWKTFQINKKIPNLNWISINSYVLDHKNGGGTGKTFNWSLLNNNQYLKNVILAGGINPKNCFLASKIGCFGLDFNSGIEKKPGIKDKNKMKLVFKIIREYQ